MKKSFGLSYLVGIVLIVAIGCTKPKEPQYISFENLQVTKVGLSESIVGADLKYYNPNGFNLELKKANVDVYINDKYVGHSDLDTLIHIPAKDTFYVPVSMKLKLGDLFKYAVQWFLDPEVKVKVEGTAKVGRSGIFKNFPVNYESKEKIDVLLKDTSFQNLFK
jgi:LEA14-like dessication related protein